MGDDGRGCAGGLCRSEWWSSLHGKAWAIPSKHLHLSITLPKREAKTPNNHKRAALSSRPCQLGNMGERVKGRRLIAISVTLF